MSFKKAEDVLSFLTPIAEKMAIEIVDVEENTRENYITVFIDKQGGVDLDTCEAFHNAIMDPIDDLDPSYGAPYTLNVSSPGLDRPFKTDRDFEKNLEGMIEIKLYSPYKGKKFLEGKLKDFDDNTITVEICKETVKLQRNKIAKVNKAILFYDLGDNDDR